MVHVTPQQKPFYMSLKNIVGTTHHTEVGKLYLGFAALNFIIAGFFALLMRIELISPGETITDAETYASLFTTHGTTMIFLVVFPLGAGFGNYLVPRLIGAKDMYWPRWNSAGFWLLIPGAFFIYSAFHGPGFGWTAYQPLAGSIENNSVTYWMIGVLFAGVSSLIASINFIVTIITLKKPEITWTKMDLFSWSIFLTAVLQLFALPIITAGLIFALSDRLFDTAIYAKGGIGGPILWQHLFWAYSHPAVYIMVLPAFGLTSLLISRFAQKEIFGYMSMLISLLAITALSFFVWGHHMYTLGLSTEVNDFFIAMTFIITVPSGIKTFNWILTMYGARIKFEAPMLFSQGFLVGFVIGGITGVALNILPLDLVFHDTHFVVGHFHMVAVGGISSTMIAMTYYLYPEITGKMYNRTLAFWHFVLWFIGFFVTFNSMMIVGALGMPRRYFDYSNDGWTIWNQLATLGAILMAISILIFIINLVYSLFKGQAAGENPFNLSQGTGNPLEEIETAKQEISSRSETSSAAA
ncbi:MAG: cbb3-type cytochrome c oxidase subunit I [Candidatus Heimdallarchaeota archaeon]